MVVSMLGQCCRDGRVDANLSFFDGLTDYERQGLLAGGGRAMGNEPERFPQEKGIVMLISLASVTLVGKWRIIAYLHRRCWAAGR
jgi:hypothetical protein